MHNHDEARRGRRVRLIHCNDDYTSLAPGALGTITMVDDLGTVHVRWDDGSRLGLVAAAGDAWELLPAAPVFAVTLTFKETIYVEAEDTEEAEERANEHVFADENQAFHPHVESVREAAADDYDFDDVVELPDMRRRWLSERQS